MKRLSVILLCLLLLTQAACAGTAAEALEFDVDMAEVLPAVDGSEDLELIPYDTDGLMPDGAGLLPDGDLKLDLGPALLEDGGVSAVPDASDGNAPNATTGSGKCGDNLTWVLDEAGVLTVSGKGRMWDYRNDSDTFDYHPNPWIKLMPYIRAVVFEDGVTYVGADAFNQYENYTDQMNSGITRVELCDTITEIGAFAFRYLKKVGEITLPAQLEVIGQEAFACSGIRSITFPRKVRWIDGGICEYCEELEYVKIEAGIHNSFGMGNCPFRGCPALKKIEVAKGHDALHSHKGVLYNGNLLMQYPNGRASGLYEVEDGCDTIFQRAFEGSATLQTIILPRSVKSILYRAFEDCDNLKYVEYEGSEEEWKAVSVDGNNDALINASFTFRNLPQKPTSVELSQSGTVSLPMNKTMRLKAKVLPADAETTLSWKSSDTEVAKVSAGGRITPVSVGKATIRVRTANGLSAYVKIRVVPPVPTGIAIVQGESVTLYMGNKLALETELAPGDASTKLTWKSSRPEVAAVSSKGVVTPGKAGTAKITVRTSNNKTAAVTVRVVDARSVSLKEGKSATLKEGKKLALHATVSPGKVKTGLTWTSSNTDVATVSGKGVVRALKPGKARIAVRTDNGKGTTITITVK